jgi:hypothetical protein
MRLRSKTASPAVGGPLAFAFSVAGLGRRRSQAEQGLRSSCVVPSGAAEQVGGRAKVGDSLAANAQHSSLIVGEIVEGVLRGHVGP